MRIPTGVVIVVACLLLVAHSSVAEGKTIRLERKTHDIKDKLEIGVEDTLIIERGAILTFDRGGYLRINGKIEVEGEPEVPITVTTAKDIITKPMQTHIMININNYFVMENWRFVNIRMPCGWLVYATYPISLLGCKFMDVQSEYVLFMVSIKIGSAILGEHSIAINNCMMRDVMSTYKGMFAGFEVYSYGNCTLSINVYNNKFINCRYIHNTFGSASYDKAIHRVAYYDNIHEGPPQVLIVDGAEVNVFRNTWHIVCDEHSSKHRAYGISLCISNSRIMFKDNILNVQQEYKKIKMIARCGGSGSELARNVFTIDRGCGEILIESSAIKNCNMKNICVRALSVSKIENCKMVFDNENEEATHPIITSLIPRERAGFTDEEYEEGDESEISIINCDISAHRIVIDVYSQLFIENCVIQCTRVMSVRMWDEKAWARLYESYFDCGESNINIPKLVEIKNMYYIGSLTQKNEGAIKMDKQMLDKMREKKEEIAKGIPIIPKGNLEK